MQMHILSHDYLAPILARENWHRTVADCIAELMQDITKANHFGEVALWAQRSGAGRTGTLIIARADREADAGAKPAFGPVRPSCLSKGEISSLLIPVLRTLPILPT